MKLRKAWRQHRIKLQANVRNTLNSCRNLPRSAPVQRVKQSLLSWIRWIHKQCNTFIDGIINHCQHLLETLSHLLVSSIKILKNTLIKLFTTSQHRIQMLRNNRPQRPSRSRKKSFYRRLKILAKNLFFRKPQNLLAFIFIVICLIFWGLLWLPTQHTFEGNFVIEELSFMYRGEPDKLFLNSIPSLKRIEIEGRQTLSLNGEFTTPDRSPLTSSETLELDLQDDYSKLIIEPADPETLSTLSLNTLRLQPQTHIRNFWYHPQQNRLSFRLNIPPTETIPINLSLGEMPLKITIEGFHAPQLASEGDPFQPLEIIWTPSVFSTELTLSLTETANVYLNLPELTTQNHKTWIWGNFAVEKVRFSRFAETTEIIDDLELSTILAGNIHLKQQKLTLEPGQFLIVPEPTSIQTIPRLQFHPPQQPNSLQALIQGHANKIEVGVAPQYPVNAIRGNFLEQFFPTDVINALLTFSAVSISYLIPWLFSSK